MNAKIMIHETVQGFRQMRQALFQKNHRATIGFVPTMGALHEGHLSLVKHAVRDNDICITSIFVNPTQFGPNEDFSKYPRSFEHDIQLLQQVGVHHVLAPSTSATCDLYGPQHATMVSCPTLEQTWKEGQVRPGHFTGVATIVTKLFNIVQPTVAYFGQKDAAQCALLRRIVSDLNIPVQLQFIPTVREPDGLAKSSRNAYLTTTERQAAPIVYQALQAAVAYYTHNIHADHGQIHTTVLQQVIRNVLQQESLVTQIEYIAIDHPDTMLPLYKDTVHKEVGAIISMACKIGTVRLIDNVILPPLP
jgi:pantoate--beta-alanine ligase